MCYVRSGEMDSRSTLGELFTRLPAPVTKQYKLVLVKGAVIPCGWEGNREPNRK